MRRPVRIAVVVALALVAGVWFLALADYVPNQISGTAVSGSNLMGLVGAWFAYYAILLWGLVAFYPALMLAGYALALFREADLDHLGRRLVGAVLLLPVLCALVHLLPRGFPLVDRLLTSWDQQQLFGLGGNLGYLFCAPMGAYENRTHPGGLLVANLDIWGSALVLSLIAGFCLWMMNIGLRRFARRLFNALRTWKQAPPLEIPARPGRVRPLIDPAGPPVIKTRSTTSISDVSRFLAEGQAEPSADAEVLIEKIRQQRKALQSGVPESSAPSEAESSAALAAVARPENAEDIKESAAPLPPGLPVTPPAAESVSAQDARSAPAVSPSRPAPRPSPARTATREKTSSDPNAYVLPPKDLLDNAPNRRHAEHEAEKQAIGNAIEQVFSQFSIAVQVVAATRGPVVTQYEIRLLDEGMRVGKVEGFEKDLAMKLGTEGIRIVAPLPNKKTIGIEVPNKVKEAVVMRPLVEEIDPGQMALPVVLGRDVVGKPLVADLAKMPHLLVAGATGMGKSVCMNSMICSILLFRSPDEVKFIMVDPKMVELAGYEDIPHLLTPPITEMTKAHAALEWACRTMDERYEALRLTGVRDIKSYNELGVDEIRFRLAKKEQKLEDIPGNPGGHMPYIVILVDEYADLMMVNKEVEKSIVRLASKSRACGIHVILTTQRPSADVVTGLIKSNLPCRICFRVVDKSNSRVVLDVSGAENLLGKGDMLFLQPGTSLPVRGQGVWLKDSEINAIIEHAKANGRPHYDDEMLKVGAIASADGEGGDAAAGGEWIGDRQFHEAVQSMYRYNRTGADFFRRRLNVGYNKATQYVEQLEDLGFVGAQKGTASREILKSWDDWIELLKEHGVSWDEDDEIYRNPQALGT